MSSTKNYLNYVIEQLSPLGDVSSRAMMGEYILYYKGKVFGGIYDDRLLVKPVISAVNILPDAPLDIPYEGGSKMLLVEEVDNRELLRRLVQAMYDDLPAAKPKTGRRKSNDK